MTAWQELRASLIARKPIARSSARHLAASLMLARPRAFLNARRAWLMALEGAARMLAAYLEERSAGERVD